MLPGILTWILHESLAMANLSRIFDTILANIPIRFLDAILSRILTWILHLSLPKKPVNDP